MKTNNKNSGRASSVPVGLSVGMGVSVGITIFCTAVMACLLEKEIMTWENVGYGIMGMLIFSSFCGAKLSAIKIKHQRFVICLLSGMLYLGSLLSITALFFGGQYDAVGVTIALVVAGCGCAGLLGMRRGVEGKRKRHDVMKLYKQH